MIRNYNSGLAMASMTANVAIPRGGGRPINRECRRDIFVLLFDFMRRDDVFAQSYRMMEEVVREEEERAREENRQHIPIKMVFEKRSSDRDLATSNEVAAV
ncbi:hypothetical protein Aduo_009150 [Ancylostoma duodenale]